MDLLTLKEEKRSVEFSQEELIAKLNETSKDTALSVMGIELSEATKDRVVATMPITSRHHQPMGYLHGGVSVLLAESVASWGSMLNIDTDRQVAFGLEINANHLRPKREGILTAVAIPLHRGRTTHIWDIRITDENDKLVCISRCTVAIVERSPEKNSVQ
jgi:1,4-dihydroxy-2-naphthoyl-CoA hydrolase